VDDDDEDDDEECEDDEKGVTLGRAHRAYTYSWPFFD